MRWLTDTELERYRRERNCEVCGDDMENKKGLKSVIPCDISRYETLMFKENTKGNKNLP